MWQILPVLLYLSSVQALYRVNSNNPYPFFNEDQGNLPPLNKHPIGTTYFSFPKFTAGPMPSANKKPNQQYSVSSRFADDSYLSHKAPPQLNPFLLRNFIFHHSQGSPRNLNKSYDNNPFDTDYSSFNGGSSLAFTDNDPVIEPKESESYAEDLELVDNFGNYLRKRTLLDSLSAGNPNDAAHQYNALLAVLMALARAVRNSCADFEQVYDGLYYDTVETYYKYGLANADKVAGMIEEYIRKGNSHIPKLRRLKQEICDKEIFCSVSLDNHIKSSPLMYVKELETLEALAHLARNYYPYIEEFNQAAQKGNVLGYLQRSKDRLKEYIMHIINSVEHISDRQVICN